MTHIYGFLSVEGIILPLEEFKLQRKKAWKRRLIVLGKVFGGIFLVGVFIALWPIMPPAVNIYRSLATGEVVKVETREGSVTNPSRIKEVLSGRYDGVTYYVP